MSKSLRIRTTPDGSDKFLKVNLEQDFDFIEILSLKISQQEIYQNFCADYGMVVGRVNINTGFGVPNAKVSIFIPVSDEDKLDPEIFELYPYEETTDKDLNGVRYNLLPNKSQVQDDCFTPIGTFSSKREILDNDELGEVYTKYYKFTTTTNDSGDYAFMGIPTGQYFIHVDADISDIGVISARPYDLIRQGVDERKFYTTTKFRESKQLNKLVQVKTASPVGVTVRPIWGNDNCDIGITRSDIDLNETLIPHSVFTGSLFGDSDNNAINKRCRPRRATGRLDELITTSGRIEMVRKTNSGDIERFDVEGGELIDGDGVWSYQIPMNLEYKVTDEFGDLIPSNDPSKGIPTKAKVRFRVKMFENGPLGRLKTRGSYLVPNNPDTYGDSDFFFDDRVSDSNLAELSFNKVYSVANFIPRFDNSQQVNNKSALSLKELSESVAGINNIPFNKMDVDFNPLFTIICFIVNLIVLVLIPVFVILIFIINLVISILNGLLLVICKALFLVTKITTVTNSGGKKGTRRCSGCIGRPYCLGTSGKDRVYLEQEICDEQVEKDNEDGEKPDEWHSEARCDCDDCKGAAKIGCECDSVIPYVPYIVLKCDDKCFVPFAIKPSDDCLANPEDTSGFLCRIYEATINASDCTEILWPWTVAEDEQNSDPDSPEPGEGEKLGADAGYLKCFTATLAESFNVFEFLFYNDWINGSLYYPLFKYKLRQKGEGREKFCEYDCDEFTLRDGYSGVDNDGDGSPDNKCNNNFLIESMLCTCAEGIGVGCGGGPDGGSVPINDGLIKKFDDEFYYASITHNGDWPLLRTKIISLGSILDCDWEGEPSIFRALPDTTYKLPSTLDEISEDDGITQSGIDSFIDREALFAKITCAGADTNQDRGVNIRRYCELGMGTDELRESETPPFNDDPTQPDRFMTNKDIDVDVIRNIFAWLNDDTLNIQPLSSINAGVGNSTPCANTGEDDYNQFRYGNPSTAVLTPALERVERLKFMKNSFYFYFGFNAGRTAIQKTYRKYFIPCERDIENTLTVTGEITNSLTGGFDGAIDITVTNFIDSYTQTWEGPNGFTSTNEDLTGLEPGIYTVTVIDVGNNLIEQTFIVGGPPPLGFNLNGTDLTYNGSVDGTIDVTFIKGGVPPLTIDVKDGGNTSLVGFPQTVTSSSLNTITNRPSDTYTVTLTDSQGTVFNDTIFLDEPDPLGVSLASANESCKGSSDGSIVATITGGVPPYTYNWDNGATTKNLNNIFADSYTIDVDDSAGSPTVSATATIGFDSFVNVDVVGFNVGCYGDTNGQVAATVDGTNLPFSVTLRGVTQTVPIGTVLPTVVNFSIGAGTQSVQVTNANNCDDSSSVVISEPSSPLTVGLSIINTVQDLVEGTVTCYNANRYTLRPTVSGGWAADGVGNYIYSWEYDTDSNFNTPVEFDTSTGDVDFRPWDILGGVGNLYVRLTITDSDGNGNGTHIDCIEISNDLNLDSAYIESPLNVVTTVTNVGCKGASDGVIRVQTTGIGTNPYAVYLDGTPITSISTSGLFYDIIGKADGTYSLEVINADGCSFTDNIVVNEPSVALGGVPSIFSTTNIKVINNPTNNCFYSDRFVVDANAVGGWPAEAVGVYAYQWQYKLSTSSVWSDVAGETGASITFLPWSFNGNSNLDVDLRVVITDSDSAHQTCVYESAGLTLSANLTGPSAC